MGYKEIYSEGNAEVEERLPLILERIEEIGGEDAPMFSEGLRAYFKKQTDFIKMCAYILDLEKKGTLASRSLEECQEMNQKLYEDIQGEAYEQSYTNPVYAKEILGEVFGPYLCFLASELRALIPYAFEGRRKNFTVFCELFVQVYGILLADEDGTLESKEKEVHDAIYWFYHDYSEIFSEEAVQDLVDPDLDFFTDLVANADFTDLRYLYQTGFYISDNELKVAEYLNAMPEEEIQAMADTVTEGFRIGFVQTGKDLSKKNSAVIEYAVGFERMVRAVMKNLDKLGLRSTIYREATTSYRGLGVSKRGVYGKSVNMQYEYDHKNDRAFYLDHSFVERRLETMKCAYEKFKEKAYKHAGPLVIETFGEVDFDPVNKPEASHYSDEQNALNVRMASELGQITNQYIKGEERSFTIIAYPLPSIGEQFDAIFKETVKLNTLDYKLYQGIQQKIIDTLDTGVKAHVVGRGVNHTDITVSLYPLKNPEKETIFENCVADVNIPVGEVFTSPVLKDTNGVLNVSKVYLNGLQYLNFTMKFQDGMVVDYTCDNFEKEEENKAYIYENVLMHHETLPIGEFAIGTNTTAYKMARDFDVAAKLPILIAEKTGPHFAVGDTCYSQAEDTAVFNPDGKEIVARDNEVSILRKTDVSKAYVNCHTDITIPYDELECIEVIRADGSRVDIIRDGRFVLPGTEELNKALDC